VNFSSNFKFLFPTLITLVLIANSTLNANTFYVSSALGNDNYNGLSSQFPFKSIEKLNTLSFSPGDSILFKSGDIFQGMFWIKGSGSVTSPIVIDIYGGNTKPLIDGNGFQSCILIYNDENISINNLELVNNASHLDSLGNIKKLNGFGGASNTWGSGKNVRFGLKIVGDLSSLENFIINQLYIHDIYPTPTNSQFTHLGYGIKLETTSVDSIGMFNTISNVEISNINITKTGHYGIWIKSLGLNGNDAIKNDQIYINDCNFEFTGGSGFVPNKSENVLVENCVFNHTGSDIDSRMWKRGSGMWTFDCKNVISQHNQFLNAHGPQDSYGCHVDYGNENVVFQYNYSFNNEGGFVEILGDNINCGYRYNISVNDGYRIDPNNAPWDKKGKIFWVSNFCGSSVRCPSTGSFIYNNTIFVNDTLNPEIYFWPNIGDVHVWNNLIYVGSSGNILPTLIQNTANTLDISHNIFYDSVRIDLDNDLKNNAIFDDPQLVNPSALGIDNPLMYQIQNSSIAISSGRLINGSSDTTNYLNNNGGKDYFGNSVSSFNPPNIGAYNGNVLSILSSEKDDIVAAYPTATIDKVTLSIKGYDGSLVTKIYNLNGDFLGTQSGKEISLSRFKKGIYILKVKFNESSRKLNVIRL
tara:strand:+ start:4551 stop:6470 length:1920 start_codon:yes stop_codon:yes gene_type:complete